MHVGMKSGHRRSRDCTLFSKLTDRVPCDGYITAPHKHPRTRAQTQASVTDGINPCERRYPEISHTIDGLARFEIPGCERMPIYDLGPTRTELGWEPKYVVNWSNA